jgi:L-lactate dehydrogenase complex protein LldG
MDNAESRASILARVRAGLRQDPALAASRRQAALDTITQRRQGPRPELAGDLLQRFCTHSQAMSSTVDHLQKIADVPSVVARYLMAGGLPMQAVCWQHYRDLAWAAAGLAVEARAADGDDLVGITGTFCAIAETGTLMLLSGTKTAATTSLLPETHIAIVPASRIVAGMEEGFALLRAEHGELPRAVNFVSGPSRTGDIELTIVLGAHGPYRVHLLIVAGL